MEMPKVGADVEINQIKNTKNNAYEYNLIYGIKAKTYTLKKK